MNFQTCLYQKLKLGPPRYPVTFLPITGELSRKRPVECDRNPPLSASSVTFYQHFSWEFHFLLSRIGPLDTWRGSALLRPWYLTKLNKMFTEHWQIVIKTSLTDRWRCSKVTWQFFFCHFQIFGPKVFFQFFLGIFPIRITFLGAFLKSSLNFLFDNVKKHCKI